MVAERSTYDPKTLLSIKCGIDEISSYSLLNYFQPLEEYLETAPLEVEIPMEPLKEETIDYVDVEERLAPAADQPAENESETVVKHDQIDDVKVGGNSSNVGMYAGLSILGIVTIVVAAVLVRNNLRKRRKSRTNNRRFET